MVYLCVGCVKKRKKEGPEICHLFERGSRNFEIPEGMEIANQALADFYLSNNLEEEGVALYEEVINSMEMRKCSANQACQYYPAVDE